MMNILIISFDADPPYKGGVATMTHILAKGFEEQGHFCVLGYLDESENPSTYFKYKIKVSKGNEDKIKEFSQRCKFDIILSQFCDINIDYYSLSMLRKEKSAFFSVYHSRPMLHSLRMDGLMNIYRKSPTLLYQLYTLAKIPLLPIYYIKGHINCRRSFQKAYNESDKFILLSENYYSLLKKILDNVDVQKLAAIGNPIVFDEYFPIEQLYQKKKKILVVCSFEHVKRIPVLLKIWKQIELDNNYEEWSFDLVGGGDEFEKILKYAKHLELRRIFFTGYKSPISYYKEASIMMMTSKYEGWPMVLMEGQQMGVVPISYDSFEAVSEIIQNEYNGIIVPNNDIDSFVRKLKFLMDNLDKRQRMATNAINQSRCYSSQITIDKYLQLFKNELENKSLINNDIC